jgi:N-acetylglucosaminyldiphosphoundecaprenol N-acetyl-beta-D-mannosaminyltransferase
MEIKQISSDLFNRDLWTLSPGKTLINTLNAYSFNSAKTNNQFNTSLQNSNILLPDGISVVWAVKWLTGTHIKKIAGEDLFLYEMERLNLSGGSCFFLGSTESTLEKIRIKATNGYPNIKVNSYSPAFKSEFTTADSELMIDKINSFQPDVLFIGMTAPKQEIWAYKYYNQLKVGHICSIGAVFDFYAGNIKRAPKWMINIGLEWFYRFINEPTRLWRRYLIGNLIFIHYIIKEKLGVLTNSVQE